MQGALETFCVTNRLSIWLILVSCILTAFTVHPTWATLFVLLANVGVLFLLRTVAHLEGHHAGSEKESKHGE
jgi:uncharacterized membrane protein